MKSINFLSAVLLLLGAQSAFADSSEEFNFPEISNAKNVGRLLAFPTIKEKLWYTPTAFSSTFDCFGGDLKKTCLLKVYNEGVVAISSAEIADFHGF